MKRMKLFAIALLGLFAIACTEEIVDSVQMKSSEITFTVDGGETSLSFSANTDWEVKCDADWVTFDSKQGVAGEAKVKMTVAANATYESRKANVVISAGTFTNNIKVSQQGVSEFASKVPYTLDATAQQITFEIKSNVDYSYKIGEKSKSWISASKTKAAPVESKLVFDIAANTDLTARTGEVVIVAGDASYCLEIKQYGVADEMHSATVEYLANTMDIYNGGYTDIKEYYVFLKGEKKNVALALNTDPALETDPFAGLPVGTYALDAGAEHAVNTFSIKTVEGTERCYTAIWENGIETAVIDGEVSVAKEGDEYVINAILIDNAGRQNNFLFKGKIGEIADKTLDINIYASEFKGQYDTYFASKANAWILAVHTSKALKEGDPYCSYLRAELYGPAGDVNKAEFPTGTFTFKEPDVKDTGFANGNYDAQPGTFIMYGNDFDGNDVQILSGTIEISKDDKGLYSIKYDLKAKQVVVVYDDNWDEVSRTEKEFDFKLTVTDKVVKAVPGDFLPPHPDADHVFKSNMGNYYQALWLGNPFGVENCNTFIISFGNVDANYNVQVCLNLQGDWVYEKNFRGRFCNTPLPKQVCTFSKTAGPNTLLPVLFNGNKYSWVKSSYTGTVLEPSSGTVEITNDGVKFDIEATDGTKTYKFTGEIPSSLQLAQDWSKRAKYFKLPE